MKLHTDTKIYSKGGTITQSNWKWKKLEQACRNFVGYSNFSWLLFLSVDKNICVPINYSVKEVLKCRYRSSYVNFKEFWVVRKKVLWLVIFDIQWFYMHINRWEWRLLIVCPSLPWCLSSWCMQFMGLHLVARWQVLSTDIRFWCFCDHFLCTQY